MKILILAILLFPLTINAADISDIEADRIGRQHAYETFRRTFDERLNKPFCLVQKQELILNLISTLDKYVSEGENSAKSFQEFDSRMLDLTSQLKECKDYLSYTKQGKLFNDKNNWKLLMTRLGWVGNAQMHNRISWNSNDTEENYERNYTVMKEVAQDASIWLKGFVENITSK